MRTKFEKQLAELNNALIEMGSEIEFSIKNAIKALLELDVELARKVIANDDEIDAKEKEIESMCFKLLLQQQPVAGDLRAISAALKMITDMERIGDQAADISEITLVLAENPYNVKLVKIPLMAECAVKMINDAINAFVKKDVNLAHSVIKQDHVMDDLYRQVRKIHIDLIGQNIENCEQAFDLMAIAKYFERIGDHAENIAEWVVFSVVGVSRKDIMLERDK